MNRSSARRRARTTGGQAVVEFALVLPLLLFLLLGMVELGNALAITHSLSKLTREGANIASRGTSMDTVLSVVASSGQDIRLADRGGSIVSRIEIEKSGPYIRAQVASAGFESRSRLGAVGDEATPLSSFALEPGKTHFVVEVFYRYDPVTPFARIFGSAIPDPIYDRAVF